MSHGGLGGSFFESRRFFEYRPLFDRLQVCVENASPRIGGAYGQDTHPRHFRSRRRKTIHRQAPSRRSGLACASVPSHRSKRKSDFARRWLAWNATWREKRTRVQPSQIARLVTSSSRAVSEALRSSSGTFRCCNGTSVTSNRSKCTIRRLSPSCRRAPCRWCEREPRTSVWVSERARGASVCARLLRAAVDRGRADGALRCQHGRTR